MGAEALVGGLPEDVSGKDAAGTCVATIIVYVVFFLFCGSQVRSFYSMVLNQLTQAGRPESQGSADQVVAIRDP